MPTPINEFIKCEDDFPGGIFWWCDMCGKQGEPNGKRDDPFHESECAIGEIVQLRAKVEELSLTIAHHQLVIDRQDDIIEMWRED